MKDWQNRLKYISARFTVCIVFQNWEPQHYFRVFIMDSGYIYESKGVQLEQVIEELYNLLVRESMIGAQK